MVLVRGHPNRKGMIWGYPHFRNPPFVVSNLQPSFVMQLTSNMICVFHGSNIYIHLLYIRRWRIAFATLRGLLILPMFYNPAFFLSQFLYRVCQVLGIDYLEEEKIQERSIISVPRNLVQKPITLMNKNHAKRAPLRGAPPKQDHAGCGGWSQMKLHIWMEA